MRGSELASAYRRREPAPPSSRAGAHPAGERGPPQSHRSCRPRAAVASRIRVATPRPCRSRAAEFCAHFFHTAEFGPVARSRSSRGHVLRRRATRRGSHVEHVRVATAIRRMLGELPRTRLLRDRLKKHASPSNTSKVKDPFGGCALRSPVEPSLWI